MFYLNKKKAAICAVLIMCAVCLPSRAALAANDSTILVIDGSTVNLDDEGINRIHLTEDKTDDVIIGPNQTGTAAIKVSEQGGTVVGTQPIEIKVAGKNSSSASNPTDRFGIWATAGKGDATITLGKTAVEADTSKAAVQATAGSQSHASITLGDDSTIKSSSTAVMAHTNGIVKIGNGATIEGSTYSASSGVVTASANGQVIIGDKATITSTNTKGGLANFNAVHAASVTTDGNSVASVEIGKDSKIASTAGVKNSNAVQAGYISPYYSGLGYVHIGEGTDISTAGPESYGLYAVSKGSKIVLDQGTVSTSGKNSSAVRVDGVQEKAQYGGGSIAVGAGSTIKTTGDGAHGVDARYTDAEISVGEGTTITTTGKSAYGVYATGNGHAALAADAKITASGKSAYGVGVASGGRVDLEGADITAKMDSLSYALNVNGKNSQVNGTEGIYHIDGNSRVSGGGQLNMKLAEESAVNGNFVANGSGSGIDMQMTGKTQFTGVATTDAKSTFTLAMADQGTAWHMTGDSSLTNLALDGATVDYASDAENFKKLTVQNLNRNDATAGGTFVMRVQDAEGGLTDGDKLFVEGTASGKQQILVANNGAAYANGTEKVRLVEAADGAAGADTFTLANKAVSNGDAGVVELGAFRYKLAQGAEDPAYENGQYWELSGAGEAGGGTDPSNPGSAAINTFVANYLLNYAETNTLMQRLGDLREGPHREGAWFRAFGGSFNDFDRSYVRGFDMDYGGVQAGYDHKLENSWFKGGETYVGAFIGYSNGDLDYNENGHGSGSVENKTMGMYATYVGDNGFYVDGVAKYVWSKNDFDVLDSAGTLVTGEDVNTGGVGLSLETGKRIRFGKEGRNHGSWYVEPQAQLSWQHQGGGSFTASNGLRIGIDAYDSLLGRAGVLIGYQTERTNVYAKCSYVKEFDGDLDINANGANIAESMDDDWLVYGLGVTTRVNERNSLYLDFERSSEGRFTQDWNVNAGWRIAF